MDVFTMVVLIVAISAATSVASNYFKARADKSQTRGSDAPDLQPRIDALEQRVRQLEAVVTDGDYDLKRRLEALERP